MRIELDDLERPAIRALLDEHLQNMRAISPPESVHALDFAALRQSDIIFWSAWEEELLLGCGALEELDPKHGEVKSMRTPAAEALAPAYQLCASFGFRDCGPFGDYRDGPNSRFMTLSLSAAAPANDLHGARRGSSG